MSPRPKKRQAAAPRTRGPTAGALASSAVPAAVARLQDAIRDLSEAHVTRLSNLLQ